ncbi:hypothetical protein [Leptospira perolatii]|nr:hypothetical protein [Leptospira perolatii]
MIAKSNINFTRVLLGGIAAGITFFIINGAVNGGILREQFYAWSAEMGSLRHPPEPFVTMGLWLLRAFILGIVGVWMYAGMRPRYGAGPKTALLAGLLLWIVSRFAMTLDLIVYGILPFGIITGQLIGSFFAILIAVYLGAWLYKE